MTPLVAGLQAGAAILGAIGGRKKKTTTSRTNFKQLRDDALAAGFNPATALRATGGAGNVSQTMPGLGSLEVMAEITGAGADYFAATDPIAMETRELELDLLRAEVERQKKEAGTYGTGFGNPTVEHYATPAGMDAVRPKGRPTDEFVFPVRTPLGELIRIPKSWATLNNLEAFQRIDAGTLQELLGDMTAEAANTAVAASVLKEMGLNPAEYLPFINRFVGDEAVTPEEIKRKTGVAPGGSLREGF